MGRLAGAFALTFAVAILPACAGGESTSTTGSTSASSASSDPSVSGGSSSSSTSPPPDGLAPRLVTDLEAVSAAHPGDEVSVALAPVGTASHVEVVGEAPPLIAWSTIKVPLAMAVIRSDSTGATALDPDITTDIDSALTASDNAAAARLWERLGSGDEAASAVEIQLRRGGDTRTEVPPEVTAAGHSPFGQTTWRLSDQVRFAAALPCLAGSTEVTDAMGRVVDGQRWGLGGIEGARYKGGWGPTPQGYVVRQLGFLPGTKGRSAAALQVRTGTHAQGTAIVTELAAVLEEHTKDLPTGSCD